jgi:hypothetical protein
MVRSMSVGSGSALLASTLPAYSRAPHDGESVGAKISSISTHRFWLAWIAICVVYVALRLNALPIPIDRDEGMFGYIGQVILDGGLPYRDVFEHKPPVGFYIHALAMFLVPPTAIGIHTFLHAYNFLTLVVLFFAGTAYTASRTVGLWVAFSFAVFSSSPAIQGFTTSTEMLSLLPLSMSLLIGIWTVRRKSILFSFASGLCGALAFLTKQTVGAILAFIGLYLFASLIGLVRKRGITLGKTISILASWIGGFVFVVLSFVGYFSYYDAFEEFFYWSLTHSLIYTDRISGWQNVSRAITIGLKIVQGNFLIIAAGLCASLFACSRRRPAGFFMLGLLLSSFLAAIPGTVYPHYFAQAAPGVAVAGGWGIAVFLLSITSPRLRTTASVLAAVSIVGAPVWAHAGYYFKDSPIAFSRSFFKGNPFPESEDIAAFLAERTSEEDTIFILGSEAQILLLSERRSSTPFALIYPLMSEYPRYQEFQRRAWSDVERNRPKYILLIQLPASLLWDGKADRWIDRKTRALIDQDYFLEAAMTVARPKGELHVFDRGAPRPSPPVRDRLPILVFRRVDGSS